MVRCGQGISRADTEARAALCEAIFSHFGPRDGTMVLPTTRSRTNHSSSWPWSAVSNGTHLHSHGRHNLQASHGPSDPWTLQFLDSTKANGKAPLASHQ
ncbi:unnamed protein product [Aphanomyces euteiches]